MSNDTGEVRVVVRVPLFEFDGWTCSYEPRRGHAFTRGRSTILIRERGRRMTVQRTLLSRLLNLSPAPYGDVTNGGVQGGAGIDLHPKYDRTVLDGTIARHAIGWWTDQGTPFMPRVRYPLGQDVPGFEWKKIDGPHYIRAFGPACGNVSDPVARFWLVTCAHDVLRRFPMEPFIDGEGPEYSLATMWANVNGSAQHSGALGICRELAWSLRCVVEAQRVSPTEQFRAWIVRMIDTIYLGQAYNGAVERHGFGQGLGQEEDEARAFGVKPDEEWCTSWQAPFLVRALREAIDVLPEVRSHAVLIMDRIRAWWFDVAPVAGEDNAPPGLPRYLVVAKSGQPVSVITRGVGPARPYYDSDAFACFAEVGL